MRVVTTNSSHLSDWTPDHSKAAQAESPRFRATALKPQLPAQLLCVSRLTERASPKRVGLIVFEQMTATDLTGPADAFSRANIPTGYGRYCPGYRVITVGISTKPCATESGIVVNPEVDMEHAPPFDTVIVPGGDGIYIPKVNKRITRWINSRVLITRRFATLGTGIYPLAWSGLLDRRLVVAHWRFAKDVVLRFPKLHVHPNCLFLKDGPFYTCAGATSALDLSLALIEEDYGPKVALAVAREFVVYLKRAGGQEQYSEPLRFQTESTDRFSEITTWVAGHLHEDLSVDVLAERASCSRRHFSRLFKEAFGTTPADFVERLRLTEARHELAIPRTSLKAVAASVGFKSVNAFSRAFERRFGVRPSDYRQRFHSSARQNRKRSAKQLIAAA
jgi:transcriptional regulator GlxA family with amidase domain